MSNLTNIAIGLIVVGLPPGLRSTLAAALRTGAGGGRPWASRSGRRRSAGAWTVSAISSVA
jgi:hypothetical protein